MKGPRTVALCGGGTGGHIFPALAVGAMIRTLEPERPVAYIGVAGGMEAELAVRAGFPFHGLTAEGLARSRWWRNGVVLWRTGAALIRARSLLGRLSVSAIFGTGGFVCGPVVAAAASLGIPGVIHESNRRLGLTNRLLARLVDRVAVTQPETAKTLPARKTVVTGFPLRPEFTPLPDREAGCAAFGLDPALPVVLIFGGSRSARGLNRAVIDLLPLAARLRPDLQVIWMCGQADWKAARASAAASGIAQAHAFIHRMAEAYAAADVIVARAGAGTLAEITAAGRPAVLVPYPYATGNHQAHNAAVLAQEGRARVLADVDCTGRTLWAEVSGVLADLSDMRARAERAAAAVPRDAAERLARMVLELAARREGHRS